MNKIDSNNTGNFISVNDIRKNFALQESGDKVKLSSKNLGFQPKKIMHEDSE